MARDAVAVTTVTKHTAITNPAGTAINPTNGATIANPGKARKLLVRVTNTNGTNRVVTFKAGAYPPAATQGIGDLALTVLATTGDILVALEYARFAQADGTINVDFGASMAGIISAVVLPNTI